MATINELFDSRKQLAREELFGVYKTNEELQKAAAILKGQIDGSCKVRVPYREALNSQDAAILFPHVISDVMYKPREPYMIGQLLLSRTINVDNTRMIRFPSLGAMRAQEVNEGQEYPDQTLAITQHQFEVRYTKFGLRVTMPDEVVEDSMWDMWALYVEAASYALARLKEEQVFYAFQNFGHTIYDNSLAVTASNTTGKGSDGKTNNYSLAFNDLIYAMGGLIANGYSITDIATHPMAWAIFATDPVLRNVWVTGGQVGQAIWTQTPKFDQTVNVPWNVGYQITPFIPITYSNNVATVFAGTQLSGQTCNFTDVYLLDRNQACVILQRDTTTMDSWEDLAKDGKTMKLKERYAITVPNAGRSVAVIKNVALTHNYAPVTSILTVTPS